MLVQHLVSSLSLSDCSVHRLREDLTCALNSHLKRVTIPDAALTQFCPPEDEHNSARNM